MPGCQIVKFDQARCAKYWLAAFLDGLAGTLVRKQSSYQLMAGMGRLVVGIHPWVLNYPSSNPADGFQ